MQITSLDRRLGQPCFGIQTAVCECVGVCVKVKEATGHECTLPPPRLGSSYDRIRIRFQTPDNVAEQEAGDDGVLDPNVLYRDDPQKDDDMLRIHNECCCRKLYVGEI